ncbi:MAG: HAD-IG family 5'-nucleotidase [Candidatus Sericytochromatia bacterium]|nr:HAD-IG family 5'-nucleotidase [Candidatus Tanganyikabacteria bacterium]
MPNSDSLSAPALVLRTLGQSQTTEQDLPPERRVFVNRNLRLQTIDLVGFDMDYTLATYRQSMLNELSVRLTIERLIARGYPPRIAEFAYPLERSIRGLVIDLPLGNVFKMDAHGHVGRVYHGSRAIPKEERAAHYRVERIKLSADRYACVDSLFALCEVAIFLRLVDFFEDSGQLDAPRLWQDVRDSIDEAHRDGSLKSIICADFPAYLEEDPDLPAMLHRFRSAGKRLFLCTNSLWPNTDAVMKHTLDGKLARYPSWRQYFDIVVVGAEKPAFFTDRRPFLEIDERTGEPVGPVDGPFRRGRIYQGGNHADFERLSGAGGDRVLYIGDHIYGDILRAKKSSVWRTALIVRDIEDEVATARRCADQIALRDHLEQGLRALDARIDLAQLAIKALSRLPEEDGAERLGVPIATARREVTDYLEVLRRAYRQDAEALDALEEALDRSFNPYWGPLFKEDREKSRFGEQVERYACVYTARVSNFLGYSPMAYFRPPRDLMPHELPD